MDKLLSPEQYRQEVNKLISVHGSATKVPKAAAFELSERARAWYVFQMPEIAAGTMTVKATAMKQYNLAESAVGAMAEEIVVLKKRNRHSDKNKALKAWAEENVGVEVKVDELADACGVSSSKARSFIQDRPDIFSKVRHGLFYVKDPAAERAADK